MKKENNSSTFDVIIVGGSYAGLSAAMALGRSLRNVVVIDSGEPCNRQTPHSHNFLLHDGDTPADLAAKAKAQVLAYTTVQWHNGLAIEGRSTDNGFSITTATGQTLQSKKLLFATGVKDLMPDLPGLAECWGISVLHCPYCHGYEVRHQAIGVLGNGDGGFDLAKLLSNWSRNLTLFTNGPSTLTAAQAAVVLQHNIPINEMKLTALEHQQGRLQHLLFDDRSVQPLTAVFTRLPFTQHCSIPVDLGCETTEQGHLKVDAFGATSVPGVYAAGDNTTFMRAVSAAVALGGTAGAAINRALIDETFQQPKNAATA